MEKILKIIIVAAVSSFFFSLTEAKELKSALDELRLLAGDNIEFSGLNNVVIKPTAGLQDLNTPYRIQRYSKQGFASYQSAKQALDMALSSMRNAGVATLSSEVRGTYSSYGFSIDFCSDKAASQYTGKQRYPTAEAAKQALETIVSGLCNAGAAVLYSELRGAYGSVYFSVDFLKGANQQILHYTSRQVYKNQESAKKAMDEAILNLEKAGLAALNDEVKGNYGYSYFSLDFIAQPWQRIQTYNKQGYNSPYAAKQALDEAVSNLGGAGIAVLYGDVEGTGIFRFNIHFCSSKRIDRYSKQGFMDLQSAGKALDEAVSNLNQSDLPVLSGSLEGSYNSFRFEIDFLACEHPQEVSKTAQPHANVLNNTDIPKWSVETSISH